MPSTRTILITAAGGHIGTDLVPKLLEQEGFKLVLPTSNAARLRASLPAAATTENVAVEEGSVKAPQWIQALITKHSVDTVFLCLTGVDELFTTLNFLDAMQRAGCVRQLIYVSACGDYVSPEGVQHLMRTCSAAHVLLKSTIELKLVHGNYPWTTTRLGPTLFFKNDLRPKTAMLEHGVFDEPLGEAGVSRVSTADIALAACNAMLSPSPWAGQKIQIGSLRRYTGTEVAGLWSKALGKEIRMYAADAEVLGQLEDGVEVQANGAGASVSGWGRDLRLMLEDFAREGFGMSAGEYRVQVELLGQEAEDYEGWVAEMGRGWR